MKPTKILSLIAIIASFALTSGTLQAAGDDNPYTITSVPREMSYQGILKDSGGNPVTDSVYSVTFRIFNVASGGASLWDETLPCTTSEGYFDAIFGSVNLPFDEDYWLELEIDSEILNPRQKMSMVGYAAVADTAEYAQRVGTVDGATGGTISGDINATGKATIGSGHTNTGDYAFVAGQNNNASGSRSTISGGHDNVASDANCTVGGGLSNEATDYAATVGGGRWNRARGQFSVVCGGGGNNSADSNSASGGQSSVGGGSANNAGGGNSTIGGGNDNTASGDGSTIAGGGWNIASHNGSTVGGGSYNTSDGNRSTVGGGHGNTADGDYSAIPGGYSNTITGTGDYSYLFGVNSSLTADSTFMVDMPHIHFGDETDGYEFPTSDGSSGQVMTTDGNGQLSWSSNIIMTGSQLQELYDLIERQNEKIGQLENRITEMEKR